MTTKYNIGLFHPNGCLTAFAIRSYLDGSMGVKGKIEVDKHLRHCRICSEAVDGFRRHQRKDFLRSDLEFLSGKVRKRYASALRPSRGLPVMIVFSVFMSLIILLILFFIIRQFLMNM
jgi:hypothetical protein